MLNEIDMLCGMLCLCLLGLGSWDLLLLKTLQVCTSQVHYWDVVQLVLEGGMVPDYVNIFPPMFYRCFHVCNYDNITCFYAYAFSVIIFGACKYLNVV